ncbi:hypothetical protein J5X84_23185 [Streptosporangiaceae bacterium NEAU-GS5]|nr:hypothetical protein [Streptosporangiaceae bacterium NEAU-GS5]
MEAAAWGLSGGFASGLAAMTAAIRHAGYRWPWRRRSGGDFTAWLFVFGGTSFLGAVVAAASHAQMNGPWPAFIMGVGAPLVVRGLLANVEVVESVAADACLASDATPIPHVGAFEEIGAGGESNVSEGAS